MGAAMTSRITEIEIRPVESPIWSVEARSELFRRPFICFGCLGLRHARGAQSSSMIEATNAQYRIVAKNFRTNADTDCPRTSVAPLARENKKSATLLAMDVAFVHEVNAATSGTGIEEGIARNRR